MQAVGMQVGDAPLVTQHVGSREIIKGIDELDLQEITGLCPDGRAGIGAVVREQVDRRAVEHHGCFGGIQDDLPAKGVRGGRWRVFERSAGRRIDDGRPPAHASSAHATATHHGAGKPGMQPDIGARHPE